MTWTALDCMGCPNYTYYGCVSTKDCSLKRKKNKRPDQ